MKHNFTTLTIGEVDWNESGNARIELRGMKAISAIDVRRIESCVNALSDLPQAALDGGWTRAGLEAHNVKLGERVIRLNGEAKVLRDLLALTLEPLKSMDAESTAESDALNELTEKIIRALIATIQTQGDAL